MLFLFLSITMSHLDSLLTLLSCCDEVFLSSQSLSNSSDINSGLSAISRRIPLRKRGRWLDSNHWDPEPSAISETFEKKLSYIRMPQRQLRHNFTDPPLNSQGCKARGKILAGLEEVTMDPAKPADQYRHPIRSLNDMEILRLLAPEEMISGDDKFGFLEMIKVTRPHS